MTGQMRKTKFMNNIFNGDFSSQYLYVPFNIAKFDMQKMNIDLDFSAISEDVLKKYLNGRGEGILSMFINTTIADSEFSDGALLSASSSKAAAQYIKKYSYSYVYMPPPANLSKYDIILSEQNSGESFLE